MKLTPLFAFAALCLPLSAQQGILELNPKEEVLPTLLSARRDARLWNSTFVPASLTFLACADMHGSTENLARIVEFRNAYAEYIDDVIHLGDGVMGYWDNPNPFAEVPGAETVINVLGNHDAWKGHLTWAQSKRPYDAKPEDTYRKFIKPYAKLWNVVLPEGVEDPDSPDYGAGYFYKDYPKAGLRMIFLDGIHYNEAQHRWLEKCLNNALETGLSVIGAQHFPPQCGLDIIESGFSTPRSRMDPYPDMVDSQMERMPRQAYEAVDVFIDNGGVFVCWLSGHHHDDLIGYVKGHRRQIQFVFDKSGEGDGYITEDRTKGTVNQDSFSLVTFNPSKKTIVIQRIGCKRNSLMQSKKLFCYDYSAGKILVNE